jgi:hypothetical protein
VTARELSIYAVQNVLDPLHPQPGTVVGFMGVVVSSPVAVVELESGRRGFFVQEKAGGRMSGVLVVPASDGWAEGLEMGSVVDVTGVYAEQRPETGVQFSTSIQAAMVVITGAQQPPQPLEVECSAGIASGGVLSDELEGVVVAVRDVLVINAASEGGRAVVGSGLLVGALFQPFDMPAGEGLSSIAGVLRYDGDDTVLEPRTRYDLVLFRGDGGADTPDAGCDFDAAIIADSGGDAGAPDSGDPDPADAGPADAGPDDAGPDDAGVRECPVTGHVVISQAASRGPYGGNDEFVELYNPTDSDVDISGWKLETGSLVVTDGGTPTATWYSRTTVVADGGPVVVGARGYFLFANKSAQYGYPGDDYDWKYMTGFTESGGVRVRDQAGEVVDAVGFSAGLSEGAPVANPCKPAGSCTGSVVRKAYSISTSATLVAGGADERSGNGVDTGDNSADFVVMQERSPRNGKTPVAEMCTE